MSGFDPGDRVRVARGPYWVGTEGRIVQLLEDDRAEVLEDGATFCTIDPDLTDLELIAKGNGEAPEVGFIVGWSK